MVDRRTSIFLLYIICHLNCLASEVTGSDGPYTYTKLRHDPNFLQAVRAFQLKFPHDEKALHLKLNQTVRINETEEVDITYYENKAINLADIKLDDLILEALDRSYKTRLMPTAIYNYDNEADKNIASDVNKIAPARCKRELDYLMDKIDLMDRTLSVNVSLSPELASFFDSFGAQESGLLLGNYHWTGQWRDCARRTIFDLDRENVSNSMYFRGRYCMGIIRSPNWDEKIKLKTAELRNNYFKYPEQEYDYARFFRIQIGFCMPESCDSRSFNEHRGQISRLVFYKVKEPFKQTYNLVDVFCLPDETSKLRQIEPSGRLLINVAIAWCTLIFIATLCDKSSSNSATATAVSSHKGSRPTGGSSKGHNLKRQKSNWEMFISAMSLKRNIHRLLETDSLKHNYDFDSLKATYQISTSTGATTKASSTGVDSNLQQQTLKPIDERKRLVPNDLLFLNAFKVISIPCIIIGHSGMLMKHLDKFVLDYDGVDSDFQFHFIASTLFFVDWYFVITGFLTTYVSFVTQRVEKNTVVQWIYGFFHRYWRLAPMYLLAFWFSKSLFQYTSNGPTWDYGTSNMTLRGICRRESWIWPLTLTSNLHPIHEECIMPSWYISNDIQFYAITPFILVLLHKSPISGWITTLSMIFGCIALRVYRYLTDPRADHLELMRPRYDLYMRNNWDMHATYLYPQYRIASYLVGILAGHYAYMVLSGRWNSILYPREFSTRRGQSTSRGQKNAASMSNRNFLSKTARLLAFSNGFIIVLTMTFATWVITELYPKSLEPQVKYFTTLIYATSHTTTAIGLSLMFLTIMFGQFPLLRSIMSHPWMTIMVRINYFIVLAQVEIIYWLMQSAEASVEMSAVQTFKLYVCVIVICLVLAPPVTVLIELPLAHLEREFIGSKMAASNRTTLAKPAGGDNSSAASEKQQAHNASPGKRNSQQLEEESATVTFAPNSSELSCLVGGDKDRDSKTKETCETQMLSEIEVRIECE